MRYLVKICYDGSAFYGSQRQNDKVTVMGIFDRCLSKVFDEEVKCVGCSRTDRGVHANEFYFHFDSSKVKDVLVIRNSLNKLLPSSIYVDDVFVVNDEFHARYSVKKKEYIYLINLGKYNPCMVNYVFQYNKGFDLIKLRKAIKLLSGTHDFESFTSGKYDDYVRNVDISFVVKNNILIIKFVSFGFLRYMIRNIVGLLLDLNEGKVNLNDITDIFELKNRSSIGKPAFPGGLYLNRVIY